MFAADEGRLDCVRLLLEAGVDKNAQDKVRMQSLLISIPACFFCFLFFVAKVNSCVFVFEIVALR